MERKKKNVQTDLSLELYRAFKHKLTDDGGTAKEVLQKLVELWVSGNINLPDRPSRDTRSRGN